MAIGLTAEDKAAMLSTFGVPATVDGSGVTGVFSNQFIESLEVEGTAPTLLLLVSDVPSVAHGQAVVIASASFTGQVAGVQPDGRGWVLLVLQRTA